MKKEGFNMMWNDDGEFLKLKRQDLKSAKLICNIEFI
jgi:hypothetical protein